MRAVLKRRLRRYPTADDVEAECTRIAREFPGYELLRIYFYDAPPATDTLTNPIDGSKLELSRTDECRNAESLFSKLEMKPNFALRKGETLTRGWEFGERALRSMQKTPRPPESHDFVPAIEQKGVDLRIGLDIARLALRDMVRAIVVVTGDSDLVPAFRFARREGVRVYLDHLGHSVRPELKAHADIVVQSRPTGAPALDKAIHRPGNG